MYRIFVAERIFGNFLFTNIFCPVIMGINQIVMYVAHDSGTVPGEYAQGREAESVCSMVYAGILHDDISCFGPEHVRLRFFCSRDDPPSGISGRGGARRGDNTVFFTIADERKKERDGRRFCTGKRYHTEKEKLL